MQPPPQKRSLLQIYNNSRYRSAGPLLPGGSEVVDPGRRYVFRVPWPWHEIDPSLLSGATALGAPADVAVTAPRTDGRDPLLSLVCREEQLVLEDSNPRSLVKRILRSSTDRLDELNLVLVDGRRAILAQTAPSSPSDPVVFLLLAPHEEFLVDGYGYAPVEHASGYRSHVISMLASWTWAT